MAMTAPDKEMTLDWLVPTGGESHNFHFLHLFKKLTPMLLVTAVPYYHRNMTTRHYVGTNQDNQQ